MPHARPSRLPLALPGHQAHKDPQGRQGPPDRKDRKDQRALRERTARAR